MGKRIQALAVIVVIGLSLGHGLWLHRRQSQLTQRIGTIEQTLTGMPQRVSALEHALTGASERISTVEQMMIGVPQLNYLESRIDTLASQVETINGQVLESNAKIHALESTTGSRSPSP